MKYPEFLKEKDTIAYVAPSFGVSGYPYSEQFHYAKKRFEEMGYTIKETKSLYKLSPTYIASNSPKQRAKEFLDLYLDPEVDFLHSCAGGELMLEMLPHLDFHKLIHAKPKWFMGYSDNTNLTFTLTTICDVASIYGYCVNNFGMEHWHPAMYDAYNLMCGKKFKFDSYDKFSISNKSHEEGQALCEYELTEISTVKTLDNKPFDIKGRLIGGCLDCLVSLVGTPYDQVEEFKARYEEDGAIFFLEACELHPVAVIRTLTQMKEAGWFDGCKGILFGRELVREKYMNLTFEKALHRVFDKTNIPIAYEMDFGHVPPQWPILSGAIGHVLVKDGKATIEYECK